MLQGINLFLIIYLFTKTFSLLHSQITFTFGQFICTAFTYITYWNMYMKKCTKPFIRFKKRKIIYNWVCSQKTWNVTKYHSPELRAVSFASPFWSVALPEITARQWFLITCSTNSGIVWFIWYSRGLNWKKLNTF